MDRRQFIQGIVGIGSSIALHRFIPTAWAVDHGIYTGPSYLDAIVANTQQPTSTAITLFVEELRKFPKSNWVHSIRQMEIIRPESLCSFEKIRGFSCHPIDVNMAKYFHFQVDINRFVRDQNVRMLAAKRAAENLDHAWRQTLTR